MRYIGVDTPETVKPGTPVQCFAKAASAFNTRLVAHADGCGWCSTPSAATATGGCWPTSTGSRDGLFVNAELVRRGYAQPLTIAPNVAHAAEFRRLARSARRGGRGLWAACGAS